MGYADENARNCVSSWQEVEIEHDETERYDSLAAFQPSDLASLTWQGSRIENLILTSSTIIGGY